jgi:hypothetical protein
MTTSEMIALLKQRTKIGDASKVLRELQEAYKWAVNRIFKSADGPQLLVTVGEELPALVATTRDYDLESNLVGGSLLGIQTLWAKLPSEVLFTRMIPRDISQQDFIAMDSSTAADPKIATGYPVFYAVTNFGQVRFAPALPSGTVLRADYSRIGPAPDPTTNPTQEDGTDLPGLFHSGICNKATAHLFDTLDDDRAGGWETRAIDVLNDAIFAAGKGTRTARPVETRPFRRGNRRRGI